jgi:hypothetical protein
MTLSISCSVSVSSLCSHMTDDYRLEIDFILKHLSIYGTTKPRSTFSEIQWQLWAAPKRGIIDCLKNLMIQSFVNIYISPFLDEPGKLNFLPSLKETEQTLMASLCMVSNLS